MLEYKDATTLRKDYGMLVLSRKNNESIVINGNIKITVVDIRGDKVRLGIEAPKNISVHREEIFNQLNQFLKDTKEPSSEA